MGAIFKRVTRTDIRWRESPWQIRYRRPDGSLAYESAKTTSKSAAKDLLARREAAAQTGQLPGSGTARFADVARRWLGDYSKPRLRSHRQNVCRYNTHLAGPFGVLRLRDVTPAAIKALAARTLTAGSSPATVRRVLALLRGILNHAVQDGLLPESPFRRLRRQDLPSEPRARDYDWFTQDEIAELLEAAAPRERPFLATAVYTGMRRGELCGLRWQDVDLDAGRIRVSRSYANETTKGGEPRVVPVGARLGPILAAWRENCPPTEAGLVFPDPATVRMRYGGSAFSREFAALCKRAGVRQLRFHDLRHAFATHYMRAGGNLYNLKAILGHSTITLTERYAHHDPEFCQADVDRLDFRPRERPAVGLDDIRRKRRDDGAVEGTSPAKPRKPVGRSVGTAPGRGRVHRG
ncbi:MAG: tyrosine-type recombinase/integrase [Myxococcota bacterium]|nr:tyrosine-type recombinase/integrase [Myxococcota bacterium]